MRIRAPYWGAVSVLVCLLATASLASAATICGARRRATCRRPSIAAKPGDVITLAPGATYVGNFVLPNKGAVNDYITMRSAASDAVLPRPGRPHDAGLRGAAAEDQVAEQHVGAAHGDGAPTTGSCCSSSSRRTTAATATSSRSARAIRRRRMLSQVPYALIIDRVYVHGDPVMGQKRGISLNSRDTDRRSTRTCRSARPSARTRRRSAASMAPAST